MARALITGITGSGGSYLAEHLVASGFEVHGIARWHSTTGAANLRSVADRVTVHECDLMDLSAVVRVLTTVRPEFVYHLASHANVSASFVTPIAVLENNIIGTANLLEGIRLSGIGPRIQLCSTSEVYGQVDSSMVPIREDAPLRPASPYAVSKVTQDLLGLTYFQAWRLDIIRTRMFAYLNPRRVDLFATAFGIQVARIEAGLQVELVHGNLDSVRTFIDVRDAMEAYRIAIERCRGGEAYNIGGTTTKTVGDVLEILKSKARVAIRSRVDPALLRPADVTLQIPDTTRFTTETGWRPRHSFEESVQMLLDECRRVVAQSHS